MKPNLQSIYLNFHKQPTEQTWRDLATLIDKLQQLKQKAIDAMESDSISAFSRLEETISYYRGKICIPIDEILGNKK